MSLYCRKACRRPPSHVIDHMKFMNQNFQIGLQFCKCRNPDFLLDIINCQVRFRIHVLCLLKSTCYVYKIQINAAVSGY